MPSSGGVSQHSTVILYRTAQYDSAVSTAARPDEKPAVLRLTDRGFAAIMFKSLPICNPTVANCHLGPARERDGANATGIHGLSHYSYR